MPTDTIGEIGTSATAMPMKNLNFRLASVVSLPVSPGWTVFASRFCVVFRCSERVCEFSDSGLHVALC